MFCRWNAIQKKSNFYYTRCSTRKGVASWQSPSPQLAPRHTVQDCIGGKSMATCVNFNSGCETSRFEFNLKRLDSQPFDHLGGIEHNS